MFSRNQYDAHRLTRDMVEDSMERLAKRCKLEDDAEPTHIADLGSADGSSSLATIDFAVRSLQSNCNKIDGSPPLLYITFEEHPAQQAMRRS